MNFRLLALRGFPLFIRPLAIALEGYLLPGQNVLVLVLPIAMMALTISSIPVHLDYYQNEVSVGSQIAADYSSALAIILIVVVPILFCTLILIDPHMGGILVSATCMMFLIEKLSDESSRMLEFRKAFGHWFFVQLMRSLWLPLPIAFYFVGAEYEVAFLAVSIVVAIIALAVFWRATRLVLRPRIASIRSIQNKLIFLAASFLPASYRQIPRIMITRLFPDYAHTYLAIAQLSQAVALMFNVRFQIPYRKAIARKTVLLQRRRHRLMMKFLLFPATIAPLWLVLSLLLNLQGVPEQQFALLLLPLMVADALTFAILAAHMDYLQWLRRDVRLLKTYLTNAGFLIGLLGLLQLPFVEASQTVFLTASAFVVLGVIWIRVIVRYNFISRG